MEAYVAGSSLEAYALCTLLQAAGIEATVAGEMLEVTQGMTPFGIATAPRLLVPRGDVQRAREIVADWEQAQLNRGHALRAAPLQFGMRLLLVNMTLLAVAVALHPLVDAILPASIYFLAIGNLLYLAYRRRYPVATKSQGGSPFSG